MHSQVWNDESRAVSSIAAPDPSWWTDFVNFELVSSEVHQGYQTASESVEEISQANEAPSSKSAAFQTAYQPSSTLEFDCDTYSGSSTVPTPHDNEHIRQQSQENPKSQISVLHASRCPHCSQLFPSERLENHVQRSHKHLQHPNKCGSCGRRFSLSKDLERHLETTASCGKGSARSFACKCGCTYKRKDHLLRHIRTMARRSELDKLLVV